MERANRLKNFTDVKVERKIKKVGRKNSVRKWREKIERSKVTKYIEKVECCERIQWESWERSEKEGLKVEWENIVQKLKEKVEWQSSERELWTWEKEWEMERESGGKSEERNHREK